MRKLIERLTAMAAGAALAWAFAAQAATFNLFNPANGILVGNPNTYVTTAATSSNVRALWSGTCDSTTFLRADGACVSPAGSPGGADTQVQYNNAGAFGGDAGMTYNAGTDALTVVGNVDAGTFDGIASTDWARLSQSNVFTNSTQRIAANGAALLRLTDTGAGVNQKNFFIRSAGGSFVLQSETDALSGVENAITASVNTSGEFTSLALAADTITLSAPTEIDGTLTVDTGDILRSAAASGVDIGATGTPWRTVYTTEVENTGGTLSLSASSTAVGGTLSVSTAITANELVTFNNSNLGTNYLLDFRTNSVSRGNISVSDSGLTISGVTALNSIAPSDFARLSQSNTFTSGVSLATTNPSYIISDTDGAADQKNAWLNMNAAAFKLFFVNDANSVFVSPLSITRSGTTATALDLAANVVTLNGASATVLNASTAAQVAQFVSANADGPYTTYYEGGTARFDIGVANNLFGGGSDADAGVGVRGDNDFVIVTNDTLRMKVDGAMASIVATTPSTTVPPLRVGNTAETLNTAAMISAVNNSGTSIISARDANSNSEIYIGALTDGGTALNALSTQYLDITLNGQPFAELSPIAAFGFVDWFVPHQSFAINPAISSASSINDGNFAGQAVFIDAQPTTLTGVIPSCGTVSPSGNGGCMLFISNTDTAQNLTISHQSGSSAAANQFSLPGAASMVLGPGDGATFAYDTNTDFWRAVGDTL